MLQVQNIEKYYGSQNQVTKALDRVSFTVEDGAFIAIMGASGSGKTTLLNCVAGIVSVSTGHIFIGSRDITLLKQPAMSAFRRKHLGLLFQDLNLLETLDAYLAGAAASIPEWEMTLLPYDAREDSRGLPIEESAWLKIASAGVLQI